MVRKYTENKDIQDSKGDVDPEVEIQDEKQGHVNIKYQFSKYHKLLYTRLGW